MEAIPPNTRLTISSGKRKRNILVETGNDNPPDPVDPPPPLPPPPPPPAPAIVPLVQLQELPPVQMTHLSFEKIDAVKDDVDEHVALALVNKTEPDEVLVPTSFLKRKKRHRHRAGTRCIDAGYGIQVRGFNNVDFLLVRKTALSYHMQPVPNPVPHDFIDHTTTATKTIVGGLEYKVVVINDCDYCLVVLDKRKFSNNYMFSLEETANGDVLTLTIWRLPSSALVQHTGDVLEPQPVLLSQLRSGEELWRGNWGEVWAAAWCVAGELGVFNLSAPIERIALKRVFNVTESPLGFASSETRDYVRFQPVEVLMSVFHRRGVSNPFSIAISYDLRECFQNRWFFPENQMREVEIMQYLANTGQFVLLNAFGIDEYNLYVISEFLPGASLDKLLRRLPGGRVQEATAKHIMERLFELVFILHELSIAHRDLKLDNVAFRIHPDANAALEARVSPLSAEAIQEDDLWKLLAVVIDFGQAQYRPAAQAGAEDPLTVAKRRDVRCLGRMLFQMVTNKCLPRDLAGYNFVPAYQYLLDNNFLSLPGIMLLKNLLETENFTAAQAREFVW